MPPADDPGPAAGIPDGDGGDGDGGVGGSGPSYPTASRRTYFAEERTLLAWWRTAVAAAAVALGVGGIVPHLGGLPRTRFLALGAGYGALSVFFVVVGTVRSLRSHRALASGGYAEVPWALLVGATVYFSALVVLTVIALF